MLDNRPLVSIVIPTYNRADTIINTINSVFNQSYQNYEIIIVDDASSDNTEEMIVNIEDSRIKYIKLDENSKGTKPRNVGIQSSKGDYIAFLDSDDEWVPNKLERQLNYINKSELPRDQIMCFTGIILKTEKEKRCVTNDKLIKNTDIMEYIFVNENIVQTSTFLVSSKLAKNTLFNPEVKKHQDWDFCLRMREKGAMFLCLNECLTIWYDERNRQDRISNDGNYHNSILWFDNNKYKLTKRAQYAFKGIVLVNMLVNMRKRKDALFISLQAFSNRGINLKRLMKNCLKIFLPKRIILYGITFSKK